MDQHLRALRPELVPRDVQVLQPERLVEHLRDVHRTPRSQAVVRDVQHLQRRALADARHEEQRAFVVHLAVREDELLHVGVARNRLGQQPAALRLPLVRVLDAPLADRVVGEVDLDQRLDDVPRCEELLDRGHRRRPEAVAAQVDLLHPALPAQLRQPLGQRHRHLVAEKLVVHVDHPSLGGAEQVRGGHDGQRRDVRLPARLREPVPCAIRRLLAVHQRLALASVVRGRAVRVVHRAPRLPLALNLERLVGLVAERCRLAAAIRQLG